MNGEFQSFFYWNCLGGKILIDGNFIATPSFNPSFTGIALVAQWGIIRAQNVCMFQSFFYWNCLGGIDGNGR